jgi:hypothetical protein
LQSRQRRALGDTSVVALFSGTDRNCGHRLFLLQEIRVQFGNMQHGCAFTRVNRMSRERPAALHEHISRIEL